MIRIKPGVSVRGLRPELVLALVVAKQVFAPRQVECVITSGTDGKHSHGSLHYVGQALDFRTRELTLEQQDRVKQELQERLGAEYDVVLEATHIHIEFQPKGPAQAG